MKKTVKEIKTMLADFIESVNAVGCPHPAQSLQADYEEMFKKLPCNCKEHSENMHIQHSLTQTWRCPIHGHMTLTAYKLKSDDLAGTTRRLERRNIDLEEKVEALEKGKEKFRIESSEKGLELSRYYRENNELRDRLKGYEIQLPHGSFAIPVNAKEHDRLMKLDAENNALKKQIDLMGLEKIAFTNENLELSNRVINLNEENTSFSKENLDLNTEINKLKAKIRRYEDMVSLPGSFLQYLPDAEIARLSKVDDENNGLKDVISKQEEAYSRVCKENFRLAKLADKFNKTILDRDGEIARLKKVLSDKENQSQVVDDINIKQLDKIKELEKGLKKCTDCFNRKINYDLKMEVAGLKKEVGSNNSLGAILRSSGISYYAQYVSLKTAHERLLAENIELKKNVHIAKEYYNLSGAIVVDGPQPECNCEKESSHILNSLHHVGVNYFDGDGQPATGHWTCPVHGYKKL